MKTGLILLLFLTSIFADAQKSYRDSLQTFIATYVKDHEVVTGDDKKYLKFFKVDPAYRVVATFNPSPDSKWFSMETSGNSKQVFRIYGYLDFKIHDTAARLEIYQSQGLMTTEKYKNHLFLPFTDLTSGEESYAAGRYIDLETTDIVKGKVVIDFNKAYNPYCAYVSGKYNCPIPPRNNQLNLGIHAGEMTFAKAH